MNHVQKATRVFAILAFVFILVGCSGPTAVVPPTPDIPSIRTEVASTLIAKLTIEAALNVSPTAESTATSPVLTATTAPSPTVAVATVVVPPTATTKPTSAAGSGSGTGGVVYPTATRRAGPDQAQYLSQTPGDGTVFKPGEEFDMVWKVKNIGTSTWNPRYRIRMAEGKGTRMTKGDVGAYYLHSDIKPGESVNLVADMIAPSTAGRYVSYWELVNDNGATFFTFYTVVDVK